MPLLKQITHPCAVPPAPDDTTFAWRYECPVCGSVWEQAIAKKGWVVVSRVLSWEPQPGVP